MFAKKGRITLNACSQSGNPTQRITVWRLDACLRKLARISALGGWLMGNPRLRLLSLALFLQFPLHAQLPPGFGDALVSEGWTQAVGFTFDAEGRMYVWEKAGLVFQTTNGERPLSPVLDISAEVANYHDHGLVGFSLDPDFLQNGYVYLLYAVDRHHLLHFGTSSYDPAASLPKQATIGRVTRYTLDAGKGFQEAVPNSRKVLIGSEITNGIPLLHLSHGVGSLLFGTDGSLLVSCGDGTTFAKAYAGGGGNETFAAQGLADGIIRPQEDIGAYRAQLLSSHNGKLLRIDPATGEGLTSNPFYDPAAPTSPRSRVWALGLRNPYRMCLRPGTGSADPSQGDPGVIVLGDVGSFRWEEVNVVTEGGQNFGWPIYEGYLYSPEFDGLRAQNRDAPNPLFGTNTCTQEWLDFHDLLAEVSLHTPTFPNPCDPALELPQTLDLFTHRRPAIAYNHEKGNPPARCKIGVFDSLGNAREALIGDPDSPVEGIPFDGVCTVGGDFYTGRQFPEAYRDAYFMADISGWIQVFYWNEAHALLRVAPFHEPSGQIVHLEMHPVDECLYYLDIKAGSLRKICFGKNLPPSVDLAYDKEYGPSPLTVAFDAMDSSDPEGDSLSVRWDFGDGTVSEEWTPEHTFEVQDGSPMAFHVRLTVTDTAGNVSSTEATISLNNTPPGVEIKTPADGTLYAVNGLNIFPLTAIVTDKEHAGEALSYAWQTFLVHDSHIHADPMDTARETLALLEPAGCEDEDYSYLIELTVTDASGLVGKDTVRLYPNCQPMAAEVSEWDAKAVGRTVNLTWETISEEKLSRFEVERAADGIHFERIGEEDAVGGIGQKMNYQWTDVIPLLGEAAYRLKLIRSDIGYDFSEVKRVISEPEASIYLYPNPVKEQLYITFKTIHQRAMLKLFTPNGQVVYTKTWLFQGPRKESIALRNLPKGLYFYWVTDGESVVTGKVLKD